VAVLGILLAVLGVLTIVPSVNGRLPLVLAAMFGQAMPIAPSYGTLQQAQGQTGWSGDAGQAGTGSAGSFQGSTDNNESGYYMTPDSYGEGDLGG
jgi:hypothetical protein